MALRSLVTGTGRALLREVPATARALRAIRRAAFPGSDSYWEQRYRAGGTSGAGSSGELARYKAEFLNRFVAETSATRVVEFGCGDGSQLGLAAYPEYVGLDVAPSAIERCTRLFATDRSKSFFLYSPSHFSDRLGALAGDVVLSLDVIYHLVEDDVFATYMGHVFGSARAHVVVYSSNDARPAEVAWVRHRRYTDWIERHRPEWDLVGHEPNPLASAEAFAEFRVFGRRPRSPAPK